MAANYTVFTLKRSDKSMGTGKIIWSTLFDLTPANISSISIKTDATEEVVEFSEKPEIFPLGVKGCTATLTGTFFDPGNKYEGLYNYGSSTTPNARLSKEIIDFDNTIKVFDVIENESIEYALSLSTKNMGGCRELGEDRSVWKIDKFSWDRTFKDLGKYRFNMVLSYFWPDDGKNEQRIYEEGLGLKNEQTIIFEVDVIGTDNGQDNISALEIFSPKIQKSLYVKNTAIFSCYTNIWRDSIVKIHLKGATKEEDRNVFWGIVSDCTGDKDSGMFDITCKEICDLMYRGLCSDPDGGWLAFLCPRVVIPTPLNGEDYTIGRMVKEMLKTYYEKKDGYFWEPGEGFTESGFNTSINLPGRDDVKLSTQVISGISIGKAVNDFLCNQCGMYLWYNYRNAGRLEYGFIRQPITLDLSREYIVKTIMIDTNQDDMKLDGVIVYVPGSDVSGFAGECGAGKNVAIYTYDDSKIDTSLTAIAERILRLNGIGNVMSSYRVQFPAGTVRFCEGDYFRGLGDQTIQRQENGINMEWRAGDEVNPLQDPSDSAWQIKEMIITNTYTEVIVGTSYYSVLDIYKDSLQRTTTGIIAPVESTTVELKEVIVGQGTALDDI